MDACMVHCNSFSIKKKKRTSESLCSPLELVAKNKVKSTFDGHAFWVRKGHHASEMKLHAKKKMIWHQILGHIGENGLRTLKNKCLVEGLDDCNLEFYFCEHCIYEK